MKVRLLSISLIVAAIFATPGFVSAQFGKTEKVPISGSKPTSPQSPMNPKPGGTTTTTPSGNTGTSGSTGGRIPTGGGTGTGTGSGNTGTSGSTGGRVPTGGGSGTGSGTGTGGSTGTSSVTETEAIKAIKDALNVGITNAVKQVSLTDGFFKNLNIKIPFPPQAKNVESTLRNIGLGSMVDKVVLTINRAAESAAQQATPIFVNSIKQMTVTDALSIVSNQQPDAATRFLERTTTEQLVVAFKPSIKTALDKTLATKYWTDVMSRYNKIPFVAKVNTDLPDYVTRKAISGLFFMVAQEEAKIRKDPLARTTDILDKVFGKMKL